MTISRQTQKYDTLFNCLKAGTNRYISRPETIHRWIQNRKVSYDVYDFERLHKERKKSDTLFVLGGSTSINNITSAQWAHVAEHDSLGLNWWLLHDFIPSFHCTNYPRRSYHFKKFIEIMGERSQRCSQTVFMVSGNRAVTRGIHPRILPDFYPPNSLFLPYEYPEPLYLTSDHSFKASHFEKSINYRGVMGFVMHFAATMCYSKIVLLGVDLLDSVHFYDNHPLMQWQEKAQYVEPLVQRKQTIHATMSDKGNKHPVDSYLVALNDLYFRPRGVRIFAGSPISRLADRLSVYQFPTTGDHQGTTTGSSLKEA
ncbi:hypothetical protein [Pseudodesulfovibrio sp.]|uniref:hypothetical protein n=1 Tax=unclassified Pseudodesulfovibrio TaxID=2661612 RepID=UPI003B004A90